ncbi:MAG: hypothetical protein HQL11_06425 [Candidatus Omnitrophica bacterium]|nr:hypothetical protein [Candidatus Omnitrophota bacterium]
MAAKSSKTKKIRKRTAKTAVHKPKADVSVLVTGKTDAERLKKAKIASVGSAPKPAPAAKKIVTSRTRTSGPVDTMFFGLGAAVRKINRLAAGK